MGHATAVQDVMKRKAMEIDKSKMDRARDGKAGGPGAYVASSMSSLSVSGARSGPDLDLTPTYTRSAYSRQPAARSSGSGSGTFHACQTATLGVRGMPKEHTRKECMLAACTACGSICAALERGCRRAQAGGGCGARQGGPAQGHAAGQGQEGQRLPGLPARRGRAHPGAGEGVPLSLLRFSYGCA